MLDPGFIAAARKRPLFDIAAIPPVSLDRAIIERLLPHRDPILLVDRVDALDLNAACIIGYRRIDPEDPVFTGHFPGKPVYPGALQVEAIGQIGLCLHGLCLAGSVDLPDSHKPVDLRLLRVHHALFVNEVRPGDEVTLLAMRIEDLGHTATYAGQVYRGDVLCAFAAVEALVMDDRE